MAKVFLSHASGDGGRAGHLHQWLVGEGHEVFLGQDVREGILGGQQWERRLHERLRWADAMVCVVTSAAVASTWCTAQVSIALSRGSRVLPVRAEPGITHPLLRSAQYADWAALRFPDCCFRVLLCHKLLTHVLIADFVRCPVAKP